jgi:hypothetical protein
MRYDMQEEAGRLVITRSSPIAVKHVTIAILALGAPTLVWVLSLFDVERVTVVLAVAALGTTVSVVHLLMRAHVGNLPERLVLDRAADAVTRADVKLCAMSELDRIELRRQVSRHDESPAVFKVGIVVAGLRGRGASASAAFEDGIEVAQSSNEGKMRSCAAHLAVYAGLRVEEG